MTLAWIALRNELLKAAPMGFTKQELKGAVVDAKAWTNLTSTKTSFNDALTSGNFKTEASPDDKRVLLAYALLEDVFGSV